jgi:hypothetical protein
MFTEKVIATIDPTMDREEMRAYGQKLADLYGLTYYVYEVREGRFFVTVEEDQKGIVEACISSSPILGRARLEEEVNSFLLTWR